MHRAYSNVKDVSPHTSIDAGEGGKGAPEAIREQDSEQTDEEFKGDKPSIETKAPEATVPLTKMLSTQDAQLS